LLIATVSASAGLLIGGVGLASAHEANSGSGSRSRPAAVEDTTSTTVDDTGIVVPNTTEVELEDSTTVPAVDDKRTDDPATHDVGDDHGGVSVDSSTRGRDHAEDAATETEDHSQTTTKIDDHGGDSGRDGSSDGSSHDGGRDSGTSGSGGHSGRG
jgi:hypothetical protein